MRTSPRFAYSVPKIGKGSSSLSGPSRVLSLAGPLHHQSQRASGLRFAVVLCTLGPQPLILYIRNIKPDDMNIPLLGYRALSGWSEALFTQRRGMGILGSCAKDSSRIHRPLVIRQACERQKATQKYWSSAPTILQGVLRGARRQCMVHS